MKVLLRWYWILSTFTRKYLVGIAAGVLVGVLVFLNASRFIEILPIKQTRHVGRVGSITLSTLPLDIQQKVSYGLTRLNDQGEFELDAAQTMTLSEDGTGYTYTLNPNAFWSDGEKLKASDINLELNQVETVIDSQESITFILTEPFAPFPAITSQPLLKKTSTGWPFNRTVIRGLNPYVITNISTKQQFIESIILEGPDDSIHYYFYPTEEDAVTAFKLGHIDEIELVNTPYLESWPNAKLQTHSHIHRYLALFYNTNNPQLQDKSVRQLLTYATPKGDPDSRIISPISKNSWVYNPQVKTYDYNLETAQGIIDKISASNSQFSLDLELTTTPTYADFAQEIIDSWSQVGVNAKLKIVPFPDINDYQIMLIGQQIPDDPDQYALWHSTQRTNITNYQNDRIDKLLEDGRKEQDPDKRKQIYQDFQRFLVEDSPVAFLHQLPQYSIARE